MTMIGESEYISGAEMLARFITEASWIRSDGTIKQDAFIPPKDLELSVTRHSGLNQRDLWLIGRSVVQQISVTRKAILCGRADITADHAIGLNLKVKPAPLANNANHTHIVGWPTDKPSRKIIAQQLAALAVVSKCPEVI
jgi:hypothetical protein